MSGSVTATVRDAFGNAATGYRGTIHLTSSDIQAVLPLDYTFNAVDGGAHFLSGITLKSSGTQSITATDTVTSLSGSQNVILIVPASAAVLGVSGFPSPQTAGTSASVTVTARDTFANKVSNYADTIHMSSSDLSAILPFDYTFVGGDSGSHNFLVTLNTAGTQSITAVDILSASITGSQTGIAVVSGPPGAPTGVSASSGGVHSSAVARTAGAANGSAIVSYQFYNSGSLIASCNISGAPQCTTPTSYTLTGLTTGTLYILTIRATNGAAGNNQSGPSSPAVAFTP